MHLPRLALEVDILGMKKKRKKIVVAVSGGFDPIHIGHVRMFKEAKKLGDELVVILNNDNWLKQKKGYVFVFQKERAEIIRSLECVDRVVLTGHKPNLKNTSVCVELKKIRPNIFANGGDRFKKNVPEIATCKEINCDIIFNIGWGGKIQSSSWLIDKLLKDPNFNNKNTAPINKNLPDKSGRTLRVTRDDNLATS